MQTAIKQRSILFSTPMVQAILAGRKTMTRRIIKSKHESGLFQVSTAQYEPKFPGYYHEKSIQSLDWDERTVDGGDVLCPYGRVGDVLWVRETFVKGCTWDGEGPEASYYDMIGEERPEHLKERTWYRADGNCPTEWHNEKKDEPGPIPWKPSIFMPYDACRLFLRITDIRVERLQDISEEDAIAEGIECNGVSKPLIYRDYMSQGAKYCHTKNNIRFTPIDSFHSLWESINGQESWGANPFCWVVSFERIDKPTK